MKKQFFKLLLLTIPLVTITSCSDYLDTEPITETTTSSNADDAVIPTAAEAEKRMKTVYGSFGGEYWQMDYFFNGDAQTDIAYAGADNVQNFQQDEYRILTTNTNVNRDWGYIYDNINNCNIVLNYVDQATDLTAARKTEMKGEASLIRALHLFHATQLWGDAPVPLTAVFKVSHDNFDEVYNALYPTRKPITEVYTQIIADCEFAIANAPASTEKFKANKMAAKALLAKAYATQPTPDWAKVSALCTEVIAGGYSLDTSYTKLFDNSYDIAGTASAESIWEVNGEGWGSTVGSWSTFMFLGTDWKKFNTPSNDLVKTYNDEGDIQRKAASIKFETVTWSDSYWGKTDYPFMNKQRLTDGKQNFYILRLADIILLKAEALVNQNDFTAAAALVNQVRSRVGLGAITISSKDDGINKILKERKMELAFEGHRWFDLKRTGKAIEILSQQKDGNGNILSYAGNINQNRLLWPVPQSKRDQNSELTQNPGY